MSRISPARAAARKAAARHAEPQEVNIHPFFPQVHVRLVGEDSNGFIIVARVRAAMRKAGLQAEAERYVAEATSGNYDHLLQTTMKYVEVS